VTGCRVGRRDCGRCGARLRRWQRDRLAAWRRIWWWRARCVRPAVGDVGVAGVCVGSPRRVGGLSRFTGLVSFYGWYARNVVAGGVICVGGVVADVGVGP
jgi:hypothetical protein